MVVPRRKLNAERLRSALRAVLENEQCRCGALKVKASMLQVDGLGRAADIVEDALKIGKASEAVEQWPHGAKGTGRFSGFLRVSG